MTSLPGEKAAHNKAVDRKRRSQYMRARVTDVPDNGAHVVKIVPLGVSGGDQTQRGTPSTAIVPVEARGDVAIPSEGDLILVSSTPSDLFIVEGVLYTTDNNGPDYEEGARRIGHSPTDSHIQIDPDGTVFIKGDDGTTFTVDPSDGTVRVNGGTTGVITDVTTSTDADGHVTSISLERSDIVFVP